MFDADDPSLVVERFKSENAVINEFPKRNHGLLIYVMELKSVTMPVPIIVEHQNGLVLRFADVARNVVYFADANGNLIPESQEFSSNAIEMLVGGFVRQRVEIPAPPEINIHDLERGNDVSFKNGPRSGGSAEQTGTQT